VLTLAWQSASPVLSIVTPQRQGFPLQGKLSAKWLTDEVPSSLVLSSIKKAGDSPAFYFIP
jgi:hypothetical protein